MADGALVGTECQCRTADRKQECRYVSVLEWGTWSWYLCSLELQFLGSSRPAVGFTSTGSFMIVHIMQTLSDVLLGCSFLAGAKPPGQRHSRWG